MDTVFGITVSLARLQTQLVSELLMTAVKAQFCFPPPPQLFLEPRKIVHAGLC